MHFRIIARISELVIQKMLRQIEQHCRLPNVCEVFDGQINSLPDDARVASHRWADKLWRQLQFGVTREFRSDVFFRQINSVALNARKPNLQMIAFRPHRFNVYGRARLLWL